MRIVQVMPSVTFGDAVSNDARAICNVIAEMGYETGIYAENIGKDVRDKNVHPMSMLPKLCDEDIVIFNHSTGTELCYSIEKLAGRKMMIYHNITPPKFFRGYSTRLENITEYGYKGTRYLCGEIDHVMAVSDFNAKSLKELGYNCPMTIRPILIPFEDYTRAPNDKIIERYQDREYVNILFVGRISPNKRHENVIRAFAHYKKHINPKSRLIFVGSDRGTEKYSECLRKYVQQLRVDDVVFAGHTDFSSLLAYYKIADVFLCMSEHEGFCVPLVEAMFFDIPIVAYNSSAVADTLGGSGVLISEADPILVSNVIDRIVNDSTFKETIIKGQRDRLSDFSYNKVRNKFILQLEEFINQK